jgi:hypothetical protein
LKSLLVISGDCFAGTIIGWSTSEDQSMDISGGLSYDMNNETLSFSCAFFHLLQHQNTIVVLMNKKNNTC